MAFDRWDVVTALFPFTETAARKPRPVVVLSGADFNRDHGHVIACMITTGAGSHWPSDHQIADLAKAGLSHASVVRWKVFTLPLSVIGKQIGTLAAPDKGAIAARMAQVLLA